MAQRPEPPLKRARYGNAGDIGHDLLPWIHPLDNDVSALLRVLGPGLPHTISASQDIMPLLRSILHKTAKRQKRHDINSFQDALHLIKSSKNIVVLTGAGCSVSCGIPDFRSSNGIYSRLAEFNLSEPQEMFDINYFRSFPETFYSFAKEIYPSNFSPSPSHMFIKLLEEKGKLLRNYTQNIDTLEKFAGISRVVQCHGSFATASCITCGYHVPGTSIEAAIFKKEVPRCPKCPRNLDEGGIMKPDIVFFGEKLPDEFDRCFMEDLEKVDLLIVMGSSLKVAPVADVKDLIPHNVPQILINLEALPHMQHFDIQLLGYSDGIVTEICKQLGWTLPKPQYGPANTCTAKCEDESDNDQQQQPDCTPYREQCVYRTTKLPHRFLFDGAKETDEDLEYYSDSDTDTCESDYDICDGVSENGGSSKSDQEQQEELESSAIPSINPNTIIMTHQTFTQQHVLHVAPTEIEQPHHTRSLLQKVPSTVNQSARDVSDDDLYLCPLVAPVDSSTSETSALAANLHDYAPSPPPSDSVREIGEDIVF